MFDSEQFKNAINDGRYIDAVNETLKAGSDDDKEELRGRLFGKERLFVELTLGSLFIMSCRAIV